MYRCRTIALRGYDRVRLIYILDSEWRRMDLCIGFLCRFTREVQLLLRLLVMH